MKRYILFGGECYYAHGGWNDFRGTYDTMTEARTAAIEKMRHDGIEWWHLVDTRSLLSKDGKHIIECSDALPYDG